MRFEDETWRKLYVRDTTKWVTSSWQYRVVVPLLIRKVDRFGRIDVGRRPEHALSAILMIPLDIVESAMPDLIAHDEGCEPTCRIDGRELVLVQFQDAQNRPSSGALRQREYKDRMSSASDETSAKGDETLLKVTKRQQKVTRGDAESRVVTPSDDQIRSDQIRNPPVVPLAGGHRKARLARTFMSHSWAPESTTCDKIRAMGLDPEPIIEKFRDYWLAQGKPMADWNAALRNWAKNELSRPQARQVAQMVQKPRKTYPESSNGHLEFTPITDNIFDRLGGE